MALYIGSKLATGVTIIHDKGLKDVNVTDADVRTGKVSIDSNGFRVVGAATQRFFEKNTTGATAIASDIDTGKTGYSSGRKITGTYVAPTVNTAVKGNNVNYTVATGNTIVAGNFVKLIGSNIGKVTSASDTILGIATAGGSAGATIAVKVPYTTA